MCNIFIYLYNIIYIIFFSMNLLSHFFFKKVILVSYIEDLTRVVISYENY